MRPAIIDFLRALDELADFLWRSPQRERSGPPPAHDLRRHVDLLEVCGEVGLGTGLDVEVHSLDHRLTRDTEPKKSASRASIEGGLREYVAAARPVSGCLTLRCRAPLAQKSDAYEPQYGASLHEVSGLSALWQRVLPDYGSVVEP